jgi:glutamine cyclotransferase
VKIYKKAHVIFPVILLLSLLDSCDSDNNEKDYSESTNPKTALINFTVINYFPHDTTLFTEGLLVHNGQLLESTGSPEYLKQTKSLIGIVELNTGKIDKKVELDKSKYFGEGIVVLKNKIYQVTYKNKTGFIYDVKSFRRIGTFNYANSEGWGLTTDGTDLIMSDGTDHLTFIKPETMQPYKTLPVTENGAPLNKINELEFIKGFIYANVWTTNYIVKINPADGKVAGKLDLSSIDLEAKNKRPGADALNGIAYDSASDKIYVTGKLWSNMYQINFPH